MSFRIGDTTVMASDGRCLGQPNLQGFSLSLTVPDEAEAERRFASLADGGQVQMPLTKTFFSSRFGMIADVDGDLRRYAVMVNGLPQEPQGRFLSAVKEEIHRLAFHDTVRDTSIHL